MSDHNTNQTLDSGSLPVRVVNPALTTSSIALLSTAALQTAQLAALTSLTVLTPVQINSLLYPNSTGNNSVAQLTAGATFTGAVETVLSLQAAQIEITCDQAYTLVVNQYIDAAGLQRSGQITYPQKAANEPTNINVTLPGNYFNLTVTNNGGGTTTTLVVNTTFGIMDGLDDKGNLPVATPLAAPYTAQQKATASAVALAAKRLVNGVVVTAAPGNSTAGIMVGPSGTTATNDGTGNGYALAAGQSIALACANANLVYIIGASGFLATDFVYVAGN